MISNSKMVLASLGAVIALLSVIAMTITNFAAHSAVDQLGSESSTIELQTPRTRSSWEAEEFYRKYVCDHACRYSKW